MHGVININKPSGLTSHDVVRKVRRFLGEKRVGHTGTLDPLATGVLVMCVGKATRIAQYLESGEKEYRAVMRLGVTTDTLDADGRVLKTISYRPPDRDTIIAALQKFVGTIMQVPPAFSAVKIGGVPSYKLARSGSARPNKPRSVSIREIELLAFEDPFVTISVLCSKGVYIRSLCADIGDMLGMGAYVTDLVRRRSGCFFYEDAVSIDQLACIAEAGKTANVLTSIDDALPDFPILAVKERESIRISHGGNFVCQERDRSGLVKLHDPFGVLLAIARIEDGIVKPELVFS